MDLMSQAQKVMVGGVNSPVRAFRAVGGKPLIAVSGHGSKLKDSQDKTYTDYCLSWGALILGHSHKEVMRALQSSLKKGISYGMTTSIEIEIAKFIVKHMPSIEKVRFVNSGTEATMSAIRLARGFTGRDKIIKFDGCYHGHSDGLLTTAGSGVAFLPASSSKGIPKGYLEDTLSLPFNDTALLIETIEKHHQKLAAVILEPITGNMGIIIPHQDFLKTLRVLTKKYGIVLIFDEVMTGFRTNLGGAQADLDIYPDLTCLGKIIGGGFPVGAYGGRRDIMDYLAPLGNVYQAGTFSGNPIVMQAGLTTLKNLDHNVYKTLNKRADDFVFKINTFFQHHDVPAHFVNYKSMLSLRFRTPTVSNYQDAQDASSDKIYAQLFLHLLKKNIYWPPADLEAFFISTAHTSTDMDDLYKAIKDFFINWS